MVYAAVRQGDWCCALSIQIQSSPLLGVQVAFVWKALWNTVPIPSPTIASSTPLTPPNFKAFIPLILLSLSWLDYWIREVDEYQSWDGSGVPRPGVQVTQNAGRGRVVLVGADGGQG